MPDLGPYATEVLTAYGATAVLVAGLVLASLGRAARVKRRLEDTEGRGDE